MTHIALGLCFIFGKLHGFVEGSIECFQNDFCLRMCYFYKKSMETMHIREVNIIDRIVPIKWNQQKASNLIGREHLPPYLKEL